jgi:hypothetical protein
MKIVMLSFRTINEDIYLNMTEAEGTQEVEKTNS